MEKRRLTSLRSVLLQYLVRTALACLLVAVGWLLALMLWVQNGELFLPANQAAQACQKAAQDVLPGMTAATFDETQLDSLCRYALFAAPDSSEVLATNMDAGHLQRAMENRQGKTRWHLVRTALACLLVAVGWLLALMLWVQNGELFLPANQAAQACQKAAQDVLPGMTAATFDETQLDSLCRYALFAAPDSSEVLATNMDAGHLQRAMENRQGKTRWHFGYTQYYMTSKLQDGTVCLLQFDYAVPYADPALRGVLPDMQTVHSILGILLLVGAVVWSTHRTGRFLTRETEKLTAAAQAVAQKDLDSAVFSGAKVREYESTLQALQTMGDALTGSLQKQWAMEQRQREQIIQLSHKLKTPLTIIEGNAELLAEDDDLTAEQKAQVESILQGAEQTRTYLGKIRAEVQTPLRYKRNVE